MHEDGKKKRRSFLLAYEMILWLYQARNRQQDAGNVYGNKELREIELQAAYQQVELILYRDSSNSSKIRSASASAWLGPKEQRQQTKHIQQ